MKFRPLFIDSQFLEEPEFCYFDKGNGKYKPLDRGQIEKLGRDELGRLFKRSVLTSSGYTPSCTYKFSYEGNEYSPLSGKSWRTHPDGMTRLVELPQVDCVGS